MLTALVQEVKQHGPESLFVARKLDFGTGLGVGHLMATLTAREFARTRSAGQSHHARDHVRSRFATSHDDGRGITVASEQ